MPLLDSSIDRLDSETAAIFLQIPRPNVVLFQAYFELFEGLGLVRTLDMRNNLLCVITTNSQLQECCDALYELRSQIAWQATRIPSQEEKDKYLGYFKNAKDVS